MFRFHYNSYAYFFDLLALCFVLVPTFYALKSESSRRILLTLGGMYLMYFIAPRLVLFYVIFWCVAYLLQRLLAMLGQMGRGDAFFWFSIIVLLSPMVTWKLTGDNFNYLFNLKLNEWLKPLSQHLWEIDMSRDLLTPIGISFATFRAVDLLIKTYLGKLEALSFGRVLFYGFFPPVQVVGPISEYEESDKLDAKADPQNIFEGLIRIASGFIKVFLICGLLSFTNDAIMNPKGLDTGRAWLMLLGFSWYLYLNFSGYSDIAIGAARLFGIRLKENFNFPLLRPQNIQEYWNNWHMSLSRFAQRNIFVPCGGYREKTQYIALAATMMTIAMWHNVSLIAVCFGVYYLVGLIAHRMYAKARGEKRVPQPAEKLFYRVLTYFFVILGFPMIVAESFEPLAIFYKALAGLS
ncbi:MAG: MBOAT family O-acyltransferase [Alphaproteobacteria bacterium]